MGYYTFFSGGIAFNPPLSDKQARKVQKIIDSIRTHPAAGDCPDWECQWEIRIYNGRWRIEWDQCDKAYYYDKWIEIVVRVLDRCGYKMCGHIFWRGENFTDNGIILVAAYNKVKIVPAIYSIDPMQDLNGANSWKYPYLDFVEEPMLEDSADDSSDKNNSTNALGAHENSV